MAGASVAEAAANMERGSVPSSMELRGSNGTEEEEEEDEDVLPFRAPRRVFVSVTWVERRVRGGACSRGVKTTFSMQKNNGIRIYLLIVYNCVDADIETETTVMGLRGW